MLSMYRLLVRISVVLVFAWALFVLSPQIMLAAPISRTVPAENTLVALPSWLRILNMTPDQTRQVLEIDSVLHQQILVILTATQYEQLHALLTNDDAESLNIESAEMELSIYQQAALDRVFQQAMVNLFNVLSHEQQQLLFRNLEDQIPAESLFGI